MWLSARAILPQLKDGFTEYIFTKDKCRQDFPTLNLNFLLTQIKLGQEVDKIITISQQKPNTHWLTDKNFYVAPSLNTTVREGGRKL